MPIRRLLPGIRQVRPGDIARRFELRAPLVGQELAIAERRAHAAAPTVDDVGIEIGAAGSSYTGQLSFTNGEGTLSSERAQTFAGKATIVRQRILGGVSGFHQYNENLGIQQNRWAGFASTTWQKVTLLGEYGGGTQRAFGAKTNLWAAFAELDYRLMRGINLRGKFDYLDPDKGISGDQYKRWLVETDLMPVPFTEVKLSYRNHDEPPAPKFQEYLVQFLFPF